MSVAWATVIVLVLLLPGFLFFIGLYFPERFDRESVSGGVPSQLAAVVGVSMLAHGGAFLGVELCLGQWSVPGISLDRLFSVLAVEDLDDRARWELAENIRQNAGWILAYFGATGFAGGCVGWVAGVLVVHGWFSGIIPHAWIHSVGDTKDSTVFVHVLTRVQNQRRLVVYSGYPISFGIGPSGRINYIVIAGCERSYLSLDWDEARTTSSSPIASGGDSNESYLLVDGDEIVNIFWDRVRFPERGVDDSEVTSVDEGNTTAGRTPANDPLDSAVRRKLKLGSHYLGVLVDALASIDHPSADTEATVRRMGEVEAHLARIGRVECARPGAK